MWKNEQRRILIVDDVAENIKMLIELLKTIIQPFLQKMARLPSNLPEQKKPDLILMDIVMPEMDGYEV